MEKIYDIIIIGQGIAGLTAGLYARRAGADVLILEKNTVGGQAGLTYEIGNYPGFENISGFELVMNIEKQIKNLGVEMLRAEVLKIEDGEIKKVISKDNIYLCKAVILCLGASPRKLGIENEIKFSGRGVSYCAVCDGAFFRNKNVAVVGRGNTATEDASYLANIANKVYIINRKDDLKSQDILIQRVKEAEEKGKIEMLNRCEVVDILGENKVEELILKNNKTNENFSLQVDGIFVAIGRVADTDFVKDLVNLDENGYIIVDEHKQTNVKGIYSAGDCTNTVLRQIITSASDGAIASTSACEYIKGIKC